MKNKFFKENSEQEVTSSPNENTFEEQLNKLMKIKRIILFGVLFFLASACFVCAFGNENEGVGLVIFFLSITFLIFLAVGYIITLVKTILAKKKMLPDYTISAFNMVQMFALPSLTAIYCLATIIAQGSFSHEFELVQLFSVTGFAILLFDLLVINWKEVLKNTLVCFTVLVFISLFILTSVVRVPILKSLTITSLLIVAASILFYKNPRKSKKQIFSKKHFKMYLSVATAAFVFFGSLSTISQIVTAKRIENYRTKLIESFADKIFISDTTDSFTRGYIFDEKGSYRSIYETGDISDYSYDIDVRVNWFGFGSLSYFCDVITYDENGNAVAFTDKEYDGAETVYKLSDSIPCFKHEFGEYVTLKEAQSCQAPGSKKRNCVNCGYEEISTVNGSHTYVNKRCTECGAEKQPEKSYKVKANTWYTYQDILHFQNIELELASSVGQGKGMWVAYYFVCQHCHSIDETLRTNVPEFNYPISRLFTCEVCGDFTTVKIELD